MTDRELFVVTLQPLPRVAGLQALRLALKVLLRSYGLRCVKIAIVLGDDPPMLDQSAECRVAETRIDAHAHQDGQ